MKSFSKFVCSLALSVVGSILGGLVLTKYWAWFIVPVFRELPHLTHGQGIGISLTVSFFLVGVTVAVGEVKTAVRKSEDTWLEVIGRQIGMVVIGYPFMLFAGWLWHLVLS